MLYLAQVATLQLREVSVQHLIVDKPCLGHDSKMSSRKVLEQVDRGLSLACKLSIY
jgi:hypothetical protein